MEDRDILTVVIKFKSCFYLKQFHYVSQFAIDLADNRLFIEVKKTSQITYKLEHVEHLHLIVNGVTSTLWISPPV